MLRRDTITNWRPNDEGFWETRGKAIARRNLVFSILAEFAGFSVWQLWSIVAPRLNLAGFHLHVSELFWLTGIPVLVGSFLRLPYGAAVSIFGGRTWTAISALLLLVPTTLLAIVVQHPHTPFWLIALVAATAGFGGGNFASSMANISHFYPDRKKGWALGLNAAGGNIGVAVVQFVVPWAIGGGVLGLGLAAALKKVSKQAAATHAAPGALLQAQGFHLDLAMAGLIWIPLVVVAFLCAVLFMDNLAVARAGLRQQLPILSRRHTWLMSLLYMGTFGSFIGYSSAFPTLMQSQFPSVNVLQFAFLGPLVGSLARPVGGWLADRLGGTTITLVNFVIMMAAALAVVPVLGMHDFSLFLAVFLVLFITAGVGNGSTYRMVPMLFLNHHLRKMPAHDREQAEAAGRREAAAALAFISAVGAFGGFFIPIGFAQSIGVTHSVVPALVGFAAFYALCTAVTYLFYVRTPHERTERSARDQVGSVPQRTFGSATRASAGQPVSAKAAEGGEA